MTNKQVHEALIMWLNNLLNLTVIKDRQGIARPPLPYIMVDLANFTELHERPADFNWNELDTTNSQGNNEFKATAVMEVEWVFLVFCYGDNADQTLRKVQAAKHFAQVQESLLPQLVIHEIGTVNSVPELVDEKWEPRAQVNITLRGLSSDGYVVDIIEEHSPFDIATTGQRS